MFARETNNFSEESLIDSVFVSKLKTKLVSEFKANCRNGIYALMQKRMAYNSNHLEGSTLTSEQTALLFDTGTVISTADFVFRAKDIEEAQGHFKMFNQMLKGIDEPITAEFMKSLHYQLKSGVFEDYANGYPVGEFKKYANIVGDIITSNPADVLDHITDLLTWYTSAERTLSSLAEFHARFEKIHPFQDGNGRTGRMLLLKQCFDFGIMPIIIYDTDKIKYKAALNSAQKTGNIESLVSIFIDSQKHLYEEVHSFV